MNEKFIQAKQQKEGICFLGILKNKKFHKIIGNVFTSDFKMNKNIRDNRWEINANLRNYTHLCTSSFASEISLHKLAC